MLTFDPAYVLSAEDQKDLSDAAEALQFLCDARASVVEASTFTGMASWGFASYRQLWLHRTVQLCEGIRAEWNAFRGVNALVLMRTLIENIAAFAYTLDRGYVLLTSDDLRGFHDQVMKATYGSRQMRERFPEMPSAINVLTFIDSLDKDFEGARRYYDGLSEFVHPNADGTAFFGSVTENKRLELREFPEASEFVRENLFAGLPFLLFAKFAFTQSASVHAPLVVELERLHGQCPDDWPASGA